MAKILNVRKNAFDNLQPWSAADRSLMQDLPRDVILKATVTRPRSVPHNAKYWVMLEKVIDNQSYFPSVTVLHGALKQKLGYATTFRFRDGTEYHHQDSTAFDSMGQSEFEKYYEQARTLICQEIVPNMDSDELEREMENF